MSSSKLLNVGDVVKLKSGGPLMTIEDVYHDKTKAAVAWFVENYLQIATISTCALEKMNENEVDRS